MSCEGKGQLAAGAAPSAPLYVHGFLEEINEDHLDITEKNEENEDWRIGANAGDDLREFDEVVPYIRRFLRIGADRNEEVQEMIKHHFFRLAVFDSLHSGSGS